MLAGVAAGIARYLDVDVTIVRIVFAVLAVMGGAGVPLYLAGWLLIPEEGAEQSIASDFIDSSPVPARSRIRQGGHTHVSAVQLAARARGSRASYGQSRA